MWRHRSCIGYSARKAATASAPRYQPGIGGIDHAASSVSMRQHRIDVALLQRLGVGLDQLGQLLVAELAQRRLLALLGKLVVDRLAGALQRAVHRCGRGLQRLRDLARREAEHLAQDQRGALVGRQVLQRGDERQLDALALLVASPRARRARPRGPASRRDRAPSRPTRRAARPGCRAGRPPGRSRSAARASAASRSRSGRCWWRSCRATSETSCGPRSAAARAMRAAAPPAARPRRRAPSRACGSSARAAPRAAARPGSGRRPRRRPALPRAARGRGVVRCSAATLIVISRLDRRRGPK